jgi:hypothetical protein
MRDDELMSADAATLARPRLEARRRAFVEAASEVFRDKGYAEATLDDVIAISGRRSTRCSAASRACSRR